MGLLKHHLKIDGSAGGCKKTMLALENLARSSKADARKISGKQA
jgi:hypothetical protein